MAFVTDTDLAATGVGQGAHLVGFVQPQAGAVPRTVMEKVREGVSVKDFGAAGDGTTDDTSAFNAALSSGARQIFVPAGVFRVAGVQLVAGTSLVGAGAGLTTLRTLDGSSLNMLEGAAAHAAIVRDMTLDATGATGNCSAIFLSGCYDVLLADIKTLNTPAHGIWLYNCPRARVDRIFIEASTDWAFHVQGTNSGFSSYSNINMINCANRGVLARDCSFLTFSNISGNSNGSSTIWFQNADWCIASNITEYNSASGDSAVIAGRSTGTWIIGVTAKNSGGHGASICGDFDLGGAPTDCHIVNGYFENQGECLACITDQGTGFQPTNCSIRNVHGRNPSMGPKPSEAFAIANGVLCVISGSVLDTAGTMTYAAAELDGGGVASNNRFEIDSWVEGAKGYFMISSSSSTIAFPRLERGHERKGDVDYNWNPATDRRQVLYDVAPLTSVRNIDLGLSWPGDRVRVSRLVGGAFPLQIRQGAAMLTSLTAADQWMEAYFDGSNWSVTASG